MLYNYIIGIWKQNSIAKFEPNWPVYIKHTALL